MKNILHIAISFMLVQAWGWSFDITPDYTKIESTLTPIPRNGKNQTKTHVSSLNWSGYAAAKDIKKPKSGAVSFVTGTWTVPVLQPTWNDSYSAAWVGIDGYSNETVEQIGTESDWSDGQQINYAWFQMYPEPGYVIDEFPVNPGDLISAEVEYLGRHVFQLVIVNQTQFAYAIIPTECTRSKHAKRSSAEWIVEAPSDENGNVLPLADFDNVNFCNCYTNIHNTFGSISSKQWDSARITMEDLEDHVKANPLHLINRGTQFTDIWHREY